MENLTQFIPVAATIIGGLFSVKMLTLVFARWDKWQEKRAKKKEVLKEQTALHLTESVERKKLDYEHEKHFIEVLQREREFYKAEAEKWREKRDTDVERWRSIAEKATADVAEMTRTLATVQLLQEKHSQEIEESREREKRCLENVQRLEKEIDELKSRVTEIE
jgi:chromosome segregation ATPase